ncbi:LuxR family transcriptional regulator [Sphingomonas koreensis]|nr:LuxR family transcriptional regulator [Sphingomonas koreensis]
MQALALDTLALLGAADTPAALRAALIAVAEDMGFRYVALAYHADSVRGTGARLRLDNYPPTGTSTGEHHWLERRDPARRASQVTSAGFRWSELAELITLTPDEAAFLAGLRGAGVGEGYTVPLSIPGEAIGWCSFAVALDTPLPAAALPLAPAVGSAAFETARRLCAPRRAAGALPALTARQRHCVLWAARGKSDWEISAILGISPETVSRHLKQARERYGVQKRTSLVIRALFDGSLSFSDVLSH